MNEIIKDVDFATGIRSTRKHTTATPITKIDFGVVIAKFKIKILYFILSIP